MDVQLLQKELLKEKLISKQMSKQVEELSKDQLKANSELNRKEVFELFLKASENNSLQPHDSLVQAVDIENMLYFVMNDTTDLFKGDDITLPLPNTYGSLWVLFSKKDLLKKQKQYKKTIEIFHKYLLFTNLEKENIQKELQNRIIAYDKSFYTFCIQQLEN